MRALSGTAITNATIRATPRPQATKAFALFECMIAEDGMYLSEDFAFCRRWTDMGGEIWADLGSKLSHVGPMTFRRSCRRNLRRLNERPGDYANIFIQVATNPAARRTRPCRY